jgi:hypothetical protein
VSDIDPNNTGRLRFNFSGNGLAPILSASSPTPMVNSQSAEQPDNFGFVGWMYGTSPTYPTISDIPPPADPNELFLEWPGPGQTSPQIQFSHNADANGIATVLEISFHEYDDGTTSDSGFGRGDRFRFGAGVVRVGGGGNFNTANGDDVGDERVKITVFFKDTDENPLPPEDGVTSYFTNTAYSGNQCGSEWEQDDLENYHLIVHPIRLLDPDATPLIARDLPCPLTSAANNDKPSIVMALGSGAGVGSYVVRAQATHIVPSLICNFLGIDFGGPFTVSAQTTAMYDCELQRPQLIRVEPENFYCPTGPASP